MKYGTFHYGEYPYGNYELNAVPGAIGQVKYRLSTLGNHGTELGSKIVNQIETIYAPTNKIRISYNNSFIVSTSISLPIGPTRMRIRSNTSGWLISEIGTMRAD